MPIYEYRCRACGTVEEWIRPVGDDGSDLKCESCGEGPLERVPSTFATSGGCGSGGFT